MALSYSPLNTKNTGFGMGKVDGFNFGSFAIAVVGAMIVLFIYHKMSNQ
ncbi:GlsB/YeaQ/YmgE family stress response membrane protein [Xenorhabdus sp. psl]|nr:GlsB/YeaQ/YmgE family stress response membrane protein [Xenorhabdus sp. psl]